MQAVIRFTRSLLALVGGCLGALALFGILIGLSWPLARFDGRTLQIAILLAISGLCFLAAGLFSGLIAGRRRAVHGLALGLGAGLFSFIYILGIDHPLLPISLAGGAALLGLIGGWLAEKVVS